MTVMPSRHPSRPFAILALVCALSGLASAQTAQPARPAAPGRQAARSGRRAGGARTGAVRTSRRRHRAARVSAHRQGGVQPSHRQGHHRRAAGHVERRRPDARRGLPTHRRRKHVRGSARLGRRRAGELQFVDHYRYNIAAWRLAGPGGSRAHDAAHPRTAHQRRARGAVVVGRRRAHGRAGTRGQGVAAPDGRGRPVARERQSMWVFAELVRDTDRNKGNVVYTKTGGVIMLDFTRAFRLQKELKAAGHVERLSPACCSRSCGRSPSRP